MTRTHGSSGRPAAAPRHLTRRRFRPDIPDAKFVSQSSAARSKSRLGRPQPAYRQQEVLQAREALYLRKRRTALVIVILVSVSIPALAVSLLLTL